VLNVADAMLLSKHVQGVLLVVKAGRTPRALIRQAVAGLARGGANFLGVVLNRVLPQSGYPASPRHSLIFYKTLTATWERLRRWSGV
jgi:Mrp family chromosome partitioning ATPase